MLNRELPGSGPRHSVLGVASWPVRLIVVAALLLAVPFLFDAGSTAQAADREISGLTLASPNPGELVISWDVASPAPEDYRVMWAPSSERFLSWKKANTDRAGNAYPSGATHTVTGLPEGQEYKVRVRARYGRRAPSAISIAATAAAATTTAAMSQRRGWPTKSAPRELPARVASGVARLARSRRAPAVASSRKSQHGHD